MRVIFEEVLHSSGRGGEIDENSKLSKEMLGKGLENMGKTLSDQELNDVFNLADANGDGGVSFEVGHPSNASKSFSVPSHLCSFLRQHTFPPPSHTCS